MATVGWGLEKGRVVSDGMTELKGWWKRRRGCLRSGSRGEIEECGRDIESRGRNVHGR